MASEGDVFFLSTPRLRFRVWAESDLDLALQLWGDPAVTTLIGGPFSEAQVRARLDRERATQQQRGVSYWPIFVAATGEFAGCCGLRPYGADGGNVLEFGVHLRPACWGRGYALEAGRAAIDHAFTALHAARLFAGHHPDNSASRGVLLRLGFVHTHEELYPPTGRMHPSYSLARAEPAPP